MEERIDEIFSNEYSEFLEEDKKILKDIFITLKENEIVTHAGITRILKEASELASYVTTIN